jgi:hypothetical protein
MVGQLVNIFTKYCSLLLSPNSEDSQRINVMKIKHHPFETFDWSAIPKEEHTGISGIAYWQTIMLGEIRIRTVEYSEGYLADHWCSKGHIIFCIDGEMETELKDGRKYILKKGMTYHVGDESDAHRSSSEKGCELFIVD